ncbi:hypothetical protein DFH06DRAFT_1328854 [Mycena polygramma]|nr:hypothetical protein DFH06DRAFT_1328854 [Mycena polygramma]
MDVFAITRLPYKSDSKTQGRATPTPFPKWFALSSASLLCLPPPPSVRALSYNATSGPSSTAAMAFKQKGGDVAGSSNAVFSHPDAQAVLAAFAALVALIEVAFADLTSVLGDLLMIPNEEFAAFVCQALQILSNIINGFCGALYAKCPAPDKPTATGFENRILKALDIAINAYCG